ncbi:hypothetical protein [Dongia deserti]|uniref:hypothetical protein n=1 Tax=Dongia deserti TaxID=2268030 RepID=UPI000E65C5FF|nr:hypothetical protein [Dongia deserti]
MTRKIALAFGIGASLILAAGAASADCATEVNALQQQLGALDVPATSSDTEMSATGGVTTTPSDSKIEPSTDQPDVAETAPTTDDPTVTGTETTTETESTATADTITTTPSDSKIEPSTDQPDIASGTTTVPSGTVGTGTVTETTRLGDIPADNRSAAIASLKQAQLHADAGNEDACMSELEMAKQHLGVE